MLNVPAKFYTLCRLCLSTIRDCDLPEATVNFREQQHQAPTTSRHRHHQQRNGHQQPEPELVAEQAEHELMEQQQLPIVECNVEIVCTEEDEVMVVPGGRSQTDGVTACSPHTSSVDQLLEAAAPEHDADSGGGGEDGGGGGSHVPQKDEVSALPVVVAANGDAADGNHISSSGRNSCSNSDEDDDYEDDDVFSAGNMCPDLPKRIWTCLSIKVGVIQRLHFTVPLMSF
uniref:Uncharacterized protein n=1 Tax=Anopheles dirus TaxID=7168 RepID=A0A182NUR5_9DIPT